MSTCRRGLFVQLMLGAQRSEESKSCGSHLWCSIVSVHGHTTDTSKIDKINSLARLASNRVSGSLLQVVMWGDAANLWRLSSVLGQSSTLVTSVYTLYSILRAHCKELVSCFWRFGRVFPLNPRGCVETIDMLVQGKYFRNNLLENMVRCTSIILFTQHKTAMCYSNSD